MNKEITIKLIIDQDGNVQEIKVVEEKNTKDNNEKALKNVLQQLTDNENTKKPTPKAIRHGIRVGIRCYTMQKSRRSKSKILTTAYKYSRNKITN